MTNRDDTVYLRHILDAIHQIRTYLEHVSEEKFLQTPLLQDAVVRQLEIIGEASRNLSDNLHQSHPKIPWQQVIALRNRLTHAYFSINYQTVWEIIQVDLPYLEQQIKAILNPTVL